MLFVSQHPLVRDKVTELRTAQTTPARFRGLVRELALLLGYEATRDFPLEDVTVSTPLSDAPGHRLPSTIGLIPILRAGLGMVDGLLELMPRAEVWHLGLYRDEATLKPVEYYNRLPTGRIPADHNIELCLVLDPMLATGGSAIAAIDVLKRWTTLRIKYLGLIAAPEGVAALETAHPDVDIHVAALDSHLNEHGYIVPGLGDAGDRQFGT
ncbi:MAG: uracil phosphoribosyltransferase [Chloroflexota bacterium]